MALVLLGTRIGLAAVFATAGFAKLADRAGSQRALADFGVPGRVAGLLGTLLPLAELATATALVPDGSALWGALAALALLLAFSAAIALNLSRGRAPDCHCFGQLQSAPVSWWTVARNLLLALVAAGLVWRSGPAGILLAAVAAAIGVSVLERRRSRDELPARGLPIGTEAPGFGLPALDGAAVTLGALRERGRPVLLVFSDAHCGPCTALAPDNRSLATRARRSSDDRGDRARARAGVRAGRARAHVRARRGGRRGSVRLQRHWDLERRPRRRQGQDRKQPRAGRGGDQPARGERDRRRRAGSRAT